MSVTALFVATALAYALAAALYLLHLARGVQGVERRAHAVLGMAVVAHAIFVALEARVSGHGFFADIHGTLTVLSLGIAITFLLATLRYRVAVLGAFVTPVTLLVLLASGLAHQIAPVPPQLQRALLPVHVGVNVLGLAAFALAFGASTGYVLQERKLRRKELGGVFRRLPPLDVLDTVSFRALTIGFPLFSVGVVIGTLWIVRVPDGSIHFSLAHSIGLVTWLVFASVLALRVLAGWRGRRAAIGTMLGFACAVAVLASYVFLPGSGS